MIAPCVIPEQFSPRVRRVADLLAERRIVFPQMVREIDAGQLQGPARGRWLALTHQIEEVQKGAE